MRTMNYKFNIGRGMGSIIACLVAMVMGLSLTACVGNDDNAVPAPVEDQNQLGELIRGDWYAVYSTSGTTKAWKKDDMKTETTVDYTQVMDCYYFGSQESVSRGTLIRYYYEGDNLLPTAFNHILFDYTSTEEKSAATEKYGIVKGQIALSFNENSSWSWKENAPTRATLYYDNGSITANGQNGQEIMLTAADEQMTDYLTQLWGQGGGTDSTSPADAYKPSVDHSKWMAPLADSRMVADLSLPGTHNACTAEGWHLAQLISESTAKAQDLTIDEQLKVGVRVFDLRPERVLNPATASYELRCSHGIVQTSLLVKDFFLKIKTFLAENPTEFCIVTCNLTNSNDPVGYSNWRKDFAELINGSDLSGLFADFKPAITVGEMRGRVLLLSRYEYDGNIVGGICQDWSNDKKLENQTKGKIKAANGGEAPLWTQDYYSVGSDLTGKDEAIRYMLDATAARDMTSVTPAWVFNYSAGHVGLACSDHYRENAARTNRLVIDYLQNPLHNASTGIIYMDYAGMDKTPGYNSSTVYDTYGLQLVEALINQNFRTPSTVDGSLFSVCTLNVDGLPAFDFVNNDGPDTEFTTVISRYLADKAFDFIGVQENFNFDKELGRCLIANYDHDSWAGGMTLDNLFNDHIHVAVFHTDGCKAWWRSNHNVVRTDSIRWNDRYGYADHCLDEAATKGFRRYEITTTDGYQLVVYNMHMEASERWDEVGGTDDEDRACRLKQWIQLREHIFSKLDTRPVLVIGDFNTYYCRDDMKANFIDAINASGRATCGDAWIEKCRGGVYPALEEDKKIKDDGDWLGWTIRGEMPDKILYINPTGGHSVELLSCTYDNAQNSRDYFKPSGYAKDHEEPLGDHFPLFATFRLK